MSQTFISHRKAPALLAISALLCALVLTLAPAALAAGGPVSLDALTGQVAKTPAAASLSQAMGPAASAVVYDATSNPLPPNLPSVGFQATQTAEFGDYVHLAGTNRVLRTVTVTMSDWALYSDFASDPRYAGNSATWSHPITLNIYNVVPGTPNMLGSLLATVTQTFAIPWRPVADPTCSTPTAWRAGDGTCYNGFAFNITFDMSSLNVTLPNDIVIGVAYNTYTWGASPIGSHGPYESLNVGALGTATVGTDDNTDKVFYNTSTAAWYADGGAAGVGIFREDSNWTPNGTVNFQITADTPCTTDCYVDALTGNDANVGTAAYPFKTIQKGVNTVVAGGTVTVAAGAYAESLALNKSVTLLGAQANVAVTGRTPGGATESKITGLTTVSASNVTINGFTLSNPGATYAVTVNAAAAATTVKHNLIDTVGSPALASNVHAVIASNGADNLQVLSNRFSNIKAGAKSVSAVGILDSLATNTSTGLIISGNTFTDIASTGGKGGYGVILNNGAGVPGAQITNNAFSNISGVWTHAIGLETKTLAAVVTGNTFSGLTASGADNVAVHFEKNGDGASVTVQGNQFNGSGYYGVALNPNDLPGGSNGLNYTVIAENNWWGSACGPSASGVNAGPNVDYSPWWLTPTGAAPVSTPITPGMSASDQCAQINSAAPGATITYPAGTYPGGVVVSANGLTINLGGATVGAGSPAYTVYGDDFTLNGPGTLNGAGSGDPAVLVQPGADNFTLQGVEVKGWADGVQVAGAVTSLKIVNDYIHNNTDAGLQVDGAVGGIVTIEGNLFKLNGGDAIKSVAELPAEYNSFASTTCPTYPNVDATNCTFAEVYIDSDPTTAGDQYMRGVVESVPFDVEVRGDAKNVYGLTFKFSYDPAMLAYNSITWDPAFSGKCNVLTGLLAGQIGYSCNLLTAWNGGTVATFNFTPTGTGLTGNGAWTTDLNIDPVATTAGTMNGALVYLNNVKLPATVADRDITDANDGRLTITGIAQFTGFVDVQGRADDSGAALEVHATSTVGSALLATATSAKGGAYKTSYVNPLVPLQIGGTYWFVVDKPLYVRTLVSGGLYGPSKPLSTRPETALATLVLKGGDATNDETVDVSDATCVGGAYGTTGGMCGIPPVPGTSSDVNGDGKVDILDLTLMGGNYGTSASSWTP